MSPELFSASSSLISSLAEALGLDSESIHQALDQDGGSVTLSQEIDTLTRLRTDPVGTPRDGMTALEDAFAEDKTGTSKMDKAVDAVEDADRMGTDEREKYEKAVAEAKESIVDGKPDPALRKTTVGEIGLNDKIIIMSDGPGPDGKTFSAKRFDVELPPDTVVYEKTFTYTDANGVQRTETLYFFDECANPAVDAADDKIVPVVPPCVPSTDTAPPQYLEGKTPEDKIEVMVVTKDLGDNDVWSDKDGDGKAWEQVGDNKFTLDKDELPGLPSRDEVEADIAAYEAKHDHRPDHIVYKLKNCEGDDVVVCWNDRTKTWGVLKDVSEAARLNGLDHPVIDSGAELDAYLTANKYKGA